MSRLLWDSVGNRRYEAGVNRGVLFIEGHPAQVWKGLLGVTTKSSGVESKAYYEDGVKLYQHMTREETEMSIQTLSYPKIFSECEGVAPARGGLYLDNQPLRPFSFSYQTRIGDDIQGTDLGYRIHLVYNAYLSPSEKQYVTLTKQAAPTPLTWPITTIPEKVTGRKPTSHIVIDANKTDGEILTKLEDILYGTDTTDPRMPSAEEVSKMLSLDSYQLRTYSTIGFHLLRGGNLHKEPSFENGNPFVPARGSLDRVARTDAADGLYVGRFTASAAEGSKYITTHTNNLFKAVPGVEYSVSYKIWGVNTPIERRSRIDILWYLNKTYASFAYNQKYPYVLKDSWVKHSDSFVAPVGIDSAVIRFVTTGQAITPGEIMDYDDIQVRAKIGPERDLMGDETTGLFEMTPDTRLVESSPGFFKLG